MVVTTLSAKHQTTLASDFVKMLKLSPGTRLRQWVEGKRIIIEPIDDIMTAYGSLKSSVPFTSFQEESDAAELSVAEDAVKSMRDA